MLRYDTTVGPAPVTAVAAMRVDDWPGWHPPWSRLTVVDVNTGEIAWQMPFGTVEGAPVIGIFSTDTKSPDSSARTDAKCQPESQPYLPWP